MRLPFLIALTTALAIAMCSCSSERTETVTVSAHRGMCSGIGPEPMCPYVTREGASHASPRGISNFDHAWGHEYVLIVKVEKAPDNLADAPREFLYLKSIVSDKRVPPGTAFSVFLDAGTILEYDATSRSGLLGFPSKSFVCLDPDVSTELERIRSSSLTFDAEFEFGDPVDGDLVLTDVTAR